MAFIEHDFGSGLTVKNGTLFADYKKFYQNVYPGNGPLAGAVNPADTAFNLRGLQPRNRPPERSSTRPTSSTRPPPDRFFIRLRSEQSSAGKPASMFATPASSRTEPIRSIGNPFDPTYFGTVNFIHHSTAPTPTASPRRTPTADIASTPIGLCAGHDRNHPLVAIDRRCPVRSFRQFRNGHEYEYDARPGRRQVVAAGRRDREADREFVALLCLQRLLSAGLRRPIQLADRRHRDPPAAKIRQQRSRREVEYHCRACNSLRQSTNSTAQICRSPTGPIRDSSSRRAPPESEALKRRRTDMSPPIGSLRSATPIPMHGLSARHRPPLSPATACNSFRSISSRCGTSTSSPRCGPPRSASSTSPIPLPTRTTPSDCRASFASTRAIYAKINETWKAQLNVENIFDKGYWASADGNNNISPGQPRTFRLSATASF